jgi:hypothetical protein
MSLKCAQTFELAAGDSCFTFVLRPVAKSANTKLRPAQFVATFKLTCFVFVSVFCAHTHPDVTRGRPTHRDMLAMFPTSSEALRLRGVAQYYAGKPQAGFDWLRVRALSI